MEQGYKVTTNEQGKKNVVNDDKTKDLIISGLTQYVYVKVLGCKIAKGLWDKLWNIYVGDLKVKEAKHQMYRAQFEKLRMKEDGNIATYFIHVSEITNALEGLGEPVDKNVIVRKVLRTLPSRFNPKVSILEYR